MRAHAPSTPVRESSVRASASVNVRLAIKERAVTVDVIVIPMRFR